MRPGIEIDVCESVIDVVDQDSDRNTRPLAHDDQVDAFAAAPNPRVDKEPGGLGTNTEKVRPCRAAYIEIKSGLEATGTTALGLNDDDLKMPFTCQNSRKPLLLLKGGRLQSL